MDVFNQYPRATLARVVEDFANGLAQNELAPLAGWSEAEWALASQTAFVLGIGALFYSQFEPLGKWSQLPDPFRAALTRQYQMNRARVTRILSEWEQLLGALNGKDVGVIPLKGIALLQKYYVDPATRPLADLDILIRPEDLATTRVTLEGLGYWMEGESAKPNFVRADNRHAVCLDAEHPDNPRRIEVHTRIQDEFRGTTIDWTKCAWDSNHATMPRSTVREIAVTTLFVHLLSHTSRDVMTCRARLIQLQDIALVARTLTEQHLWLNVSDAPDFRATRFFYPALALVNRYFPNAVPPSYSQKIQKNTSPRLRAWCERQTLFDVSWLGGNHVGVLRTLQLWPQSPREALLMSRVMWARRTLRVGHMFPKLRRSRWFFVGYLGYAWDQARGSRRQLHQRGRWDYAEVPDDAPTPL
jgi:hypothetical protein